MKKLLCLALIFALAVCFAGCKKENETPDNTVSDASGVSAPDSSETVVSDSASAEASQLPAFKKGIWGVNIDSKASLLYYFTESGKDCRYYILPEDFDIPFSYETDGSGYIFHINTPDNNTRATVLFADDTHAELTWETNEHESLVFICDTSIEDFIKKNGKGEISLG